MPNIEINPDPTLPKLKYRPSFYWRQLLQLPDLTPAMAEEHTVQHGPIPLTPRQIEILNLKAKKATISEIATRYGINPSAVHYEYQRIRTQLNLSTEHTIQTLTMLGILSNQDPEN